MVLPPDPVLLPPYVGRLDNLRRTGAAPKLEGAYELGGAPKAEAELAVRRIAGLALFCAQAATRLLPFPGIGGSGGTSGGASLAYLSI